MPRTSFLVSKVSHVDYSLRQALDFGRSPFFLLLVLGRCNLSYPCGSRHLSEGGKKKNQYHCGAVARTIDPTLSSLSLLSLLTYSLPSRRFPPSFSELNSPQWLSDRHPTNYYVLRSCEHQLSAGSLQLPIFPNLSKMR